MYDWQPMCMILLKNKSQCIQTVRFCCFNFYPFEHQTRFFFPMLGYYWEIEVTDWHYVFLTTWIRQDLFSPFIAKLKIVSRIHVSTFTVVEERKRCSSNKLTNFYLNVPLAQSKHDLSGSGARPVSNQSHFLYKYMPPI